MSNCNSYCSHGGVCELDAGHEGKHDSRYCQWTDADALGKDEADALFRAEAARLGVPDVLTDLLTDL